MPSPSQPLSLASPIRSLRREIAFRPHQVDADEIAACRESYVLTTGTGAGKSMAYIVSIVDRVLREGSDVTLYASSHNVLA